MAPRKLSDSDKSDIIELYKQLDQTTSTLAKQYGVSNSTISRILKSTLPPEEYSELISQKRMASSDKASSDETNAAAKGKRSTGATRSPARKKVKADNNTGEEAQPASRKQTSETDENASAGSGQVEPPKLKTAAEKEESKQSRSSRRRRKSSRYDDDDSEQLPLLANESDDEASSPPSPSLTPDNATDEDDDEDDDDLAGLDETLGDDFGDDDLDEDLEEEDDEAIAPPKPKLPAEVVMAIMPLGEAVLPKPCYLVVDMRSELITRPLSDFADLGQVPSSEEKAKTLPVFENHRVARRFSRNKQRVIKVPDGSLITRTSPYLQAKGITRLLVDGQVFDLAGRD